MNGLPRTVALIPARGGSKRIPRKNIRNFFGHPLIAHTIALAKESELFSRVIVSTECPETARIALYYGAEVPFMRPLEMSLDSSMDIEWVDYTVRKLEESDDQFDSFSILRPTSPLRTPQMLQNALNMFRAHSQFDSLRAIEKCSEHPYKMWKIKDDGMDPLFTSPNPKLPYHSSPYQSLPKVYVQNASLEIAWVKSLKESVTIAGNKVQPFITEGYEGADINTEKDWVYIEHLVLNEKAKLRDIPRKSYFRAKEHSHESELY